MGAENIRNYEKGEFQLTHWLLESLSPNPNPDFESVEILHHPSRKPPFYKEDKE